MDIPKCRSISSSRSKKGQPRRSARIAPIVVVPTQLTPTRPTRNSDSSPRHRRSEGARVQCRRYRGIGKTADSQDSGRSVQLQRVFPHHTAFGARLPPGSVSGRSAIVGKVSRNRRQKRDKDRQRRRAERAASLGWSPGRGRVPSQQELVVTAVCAAVDAVCRGDQRGLGEYLGLLATEQAPGWMQAVSREIAGFLRLSITAGWRHGWQPAELVRHVGRELGDTHASMAADVIADEMRGYAAATVGDRWAAQVSALGSEVWWGSDAEFLGARTAEAPATVQVAIERLCLLPGTARAAASSAIGEADTRILGKIRALLAKAESTEFPEEAEALSARAQELMAKHSIDHALLAAQSGNRDKPAGRRLPVDNPYESPKATLLHAVAQANRCRSVWQKALGISTVIGFPSDLDAVELLFTSLLVQANTAMLREGAKRDAYGRSRTRAFRQSFLVAYALRIG